MLRTVLTPLVAADLLPGVDVEPLVYVTLGGLYGAALFIARSRQPRVARREVDAVLDALVAGLQSRLQTHPAVETTASCCCPRIGLAKIKRAWRGARLQMRRSS